MTRKQRERPRDEVEFSSYTDYLKDLYPKEAGRATIDMDSPTFGIRLAEESLQLMRELLSKKISCVRS
ncbi:MAG: hypothetical protein RDU20_13870 [Desulfomonilaceae bacterium]|nr:hypothetical protein [Desulfomonilaceae bacterium]